MQLTVVHYHTAAGKPKKQATLLFHLPPFHVYTDGFRVQKRVLTPFPTLFPPFPAVWGYTAEGHYIMAVYEELDETTILPVTAYEVPEPG